MKRRLIVAFMALVIVVALAIVVGHALKSAPEASYQGRSAEAWLPELFTTNRFLADEAFVAMGTNAYPTLARELRKRGSVFDRFYQRLYPKLPAAARKHLVLPMTRDLRIMAVEIVLRNDQSSRKLLPELLEEAASEEGPSFDTLERMVGDMVQYGDSNAVPIFVRGLQRTNLVDGITAAVALIRIGPAALPAIPALTKAAMDKNVNLRLTAAGAIWEIDRDTNTVAAVYRGIITDELNASLNSRKAAAIALSRIDPGDTSPLPILMDWLNEPEENSRITAAISLARYGSAAREAVPALILMVEYGSQSERTTALTALRRIDPETAVKHEGARISFP